MLQQMNRFVGSATGRTVLPTVKSANRAAKWVAVVILCQLRCNEGRRGTLFLPAALTIQQQRQSHSTVPCISITGSQQLPLRTSGPSVTVQHLLLHFSGQWKGSNSSPDWQSSVPINERPKGSTNYMKSDSITSYNTAVQKYLGVSESSHWDRKLQIRMGQFTILIISKCFTTLYLALDCWIRDSYIYIRDSYNRAHSHPIAILFEIYILKTFFHF